ncbi:hypothetical protein CAK95_19450 [Pseudorhodoplanes sinuspersici]|uniref:Secreted protein n=1 Tax=Pseudorhodoplanes sinuspersici TaxID=1235591 RepID=A0A1W6ZUM9_9HYPH|nr:hypothetical protein CAK95_19450 [Pseudorhodoplanes sinuspersici]
MFAMIVLLAFCCRAATIAVSMATDRPETIDAASERTEAQRRMPGRQLSCLARNGRSPGEES